MQRRLTVVDDPSPFCSHWHASPRAANASPIWRVQQASRQAGRQIALRPTYPVRCSRWHGTDWCGSWRMTGNTSQCTDLNPGPDCACSSYAAVLRVAWSSMQRLPVQSGPSHIGINAQWERDGLSTMPPHNGPGTLRRLYTFRQQYADNPGHSIIQALPLPRWHYPQCCVTGPRARVIVCGVGQAAASGRSCRTAQASGKAMHVVCFDRRLRCCSMSSTACCSSSSGPVPAVGREAEETLLYLSPPQGPSQGQNQRAARPGVRTGQ